MFRILIRCSGTGVLGHFTQNAPLCQKGQRFENKVKLWDKISNIGRLFTFSGVSVCGLGGGGGVFPCLQIIAMALLLHIHSSSYEIAGVLEIAV